MMDCIVFFWLLGQLYFGFFFLMPGLDHTYWFAVLSKRWDSMLLVFLLCTESDTGYGLNCSDSSPTNMMF